MTTLSDIMTSDLTTVDRGATLKEVALLMREQDIGNVLIMDGDTLAGILTDRDIVVRAVAYGHDLGSEASDYATGNVFTLDAAADVAEAAREMAQRQLRRLPVTRNGRVVGIVSLADLATRTHSGADEQALQGISQPTV
ncbi:CBS domain-containing protein [Deinococcus sp. 12RED42]|uniref:CBS domain-containing protein n=1 Tax=Deinococcus sp. 12RED42 TaxID=2745872 RepID=UPI001E340285|nr:CBS domain-containing protein [Deinococcus sp. 12RED42]MCD0164952.1 CBS domain-containing protein [Deinococcus sp. 12RED42]